MEHSSYISVGARPYRSSIRGFLPPPADRSSPLSDSWSLLSLPAEREARGKRSREEFEADLDTNDAYETDKNYKRHQKIADRDRDPVEIQDELAAREATPVEDDVSMNMIGSASEFQPEKEGTKPKDARETTSTDIEQSKRDEFSELSAPSSADPADIIRRFPQLSLVIVQQPPTKMWKGIYIKPSIVVEVRGLPPAADVPLSSLTVHASLFLYDEKTHELGADASEFMAGEHQAVVDGEGRATFARLRINTVSRKCDKKHFTLTFSLFYNCKRVAIPYTPTVPFQVIAIPHKKKRTGEFPEHPAPVAPADMPQSNGAVPLKPAPPGPATPLFPAGLLQPLFMPAPHAVLPTIPRTNKRDACTQTDSVYFSDSLSEELEKMRREYLQLLQQRENDNHAFNMALFQLQQQNLELHRKIVSLSRASDSANGTALRTAPMYILPPTAPASTTTTVVGTSTDEVAMETEFSRLLFGTEKNTRQWADTQADTAVAATQPLVSHTASIARMKTGSSASIGPQATRNTSTTRTAGRK